MSRDRAALRSAPGPSASLRCAAFLQLWDRRGAPAFPARSVSFENPPGYLTLEIGKTTSCLLSFFLSASWEPSKGCSCLPAPRSLQCCRGPPSLPPRTSPCAATAPPRG